MLMLAAAPFTFGLSLVVVPISNAVIWHLNSQVLKGIENELKLKHEIEKLEQEINDLKEEHMLEMEIATDRVRKKTGRFEKAIVSNNWLQSIPKLPTWIVIILKVMTMELKLIRKLSIPTRPNSWEYLIINNSHQEKFIISEPPFLPKLEQIKNE
ncbi:20124_t:CDS:2 [Cetraspora pellucida]|uniref:20124_t:CDS:1 n=1 Tax=Cetraspora pellucida TaxID=1433469 RepID=A0A9N8Z4V2_9GLOM|nr:20124_t:CDS:2 [Cetraspora pellucida]